MELLSEMSYTPAPRPPVTLVFTTDPMPGASK